MSEGFKTAWGWAGGPGSQYVKNLWIKYKITLEGFNKLWDAQGGKCAGCLGAFAHPIERALREDLRPEVDHNHETGRVRGLLCRKCNDFLGKVKDNRELLKRLQDYLQRNGEPL